MTKIPTQQDYEQQEINRALQRERDLPPLSRSDRAAVLQQLVAYLKDPKHVTGNAALLLKGDYGYGEMLLARQPTKKMNRAAILVQLLMVYDHNCPRRIAIEAWKQLTKKQQKALQSALDKALADHDKAMAEEL